MDPQRRPVVGRWYRDAGSAELFQIVAVDEHDACVELQYFDGTVDERPLAAWYALDREACEPPQDWTGPFDGIVREDIAAGEPPLQAGDWAGADEAPLDVDAQVDDEAEAISDLALLDVALLEHDAPSERLFARALPRSPYRRRSGR